MVRDCSPDSQRRIATKLLNAFSEEENALPISENSAKSLDVTLLSGSNSYTVHVGDNEEKKQFTHEDLRSLQMDRNFSNRDVLAIANFIRVHLGRDSVETNLHLFLPESNKQLEDFFEVKIITVARKKGKTVSEEIHPIVKCSDIEAFVAHVMEERGLDEDNMMIQFGIDDGQSMLKLMLTIKKKEIEENNGKRKRYSDGYNPEGSKLSSVKKAFIVGRVKLLIYFLVLFLQHK